MTDPANSPDPDLQRIVEDYPQSSCPERPVATDDAGTVLGRGPKVKDPGRSNSGSAGSCPGRVPLRWVG